MFDIFKYDRSRRNGLYILYWVCYVLLFSSIQGIPANDFSTAFINELISLPPKVIFVFIVLDRLMDRFLFKKRIGEFITIYVVLLLFFSALQRIIDNEIIIEYFLTHWTKQPLFSEPPFLYHVIKLQFVVTIPFSIKLFSNWAIEKSKVQAVESDKMKAELNFLRSQFHPHFLFNVLNSLYSKILNQSADSADIVLKISSLLRYSIYEANEPKVKVRSEVGYIKDFIALQKIRFANTVELSFTLEEMNIKEENIAPFLIIPFVENSFKYCLNSQTGTGWITIYLSLHDEWLTLKIENSKDPHPEIQPPDTTRHSGVGLVHVKRRLALLYPERHTLKVTDTGDSYFVLLKINVK